ncbi:MAG: hypothetical protein RLZZ383_761 [Pseudomonadota bacterium]|jgi:hypothetical protein
MPRPHRSIPLLALLLTACGQKDGAPVDGGTDTADDTAPATETDVAGTDTPDTPDTEVACDPLACPPAPAPTCADATTVSTLTPACVEGACGFTEALSACLTFEGCDDGACAPLALCDIDFDAAADLATITELTLGGGATADDACCEDFTGDGIIDNRLGTLNDSLGSLAGLADANVLLAEAMATGNPLWSVLVSPPDPAAPSTVQIDVVRSLFADADVTAWQSGGASMVGLATDAGPSGTYAPTSRLLGTVSPSGEVDATGTVTFALPFVGLLLDVPITSVHLQGSLLLNPPPFSTVLGGNAGRGAALAGVVRQTDFWDAQNRAFADTCACAVVNSVSGLLLDATGRCNPVNTVGCVGPESTVCQGYASSCALLRSLVSADVDTDGNGTPDAFSTGWWLTARTAASFAIDACMP